MIEAQRSDIPAIAATLAAAFADEPALNWIIPDPRGREIFFGAIVRGTLANGLVLRSPDCDAVTLWRLPGRIHPGFLELFRGMRAFSRAIGDGRDRAQAMSKSLRAHEPRFAYWYLQFAGVAPSSQGRGLGAAAVRAGIERARAAGMPAYLETSKPANVDFYRRLGFDILDQWQVPAGPPVWSMLCR